MVYVEMPAFENKPKQTRDDMKIITMDQYQKILEFNPPSSPFRLPLMIGFHTGLRRGEVCSLQWSDISLDERTITVDRIMLQDKHKFSLALPKHKQVSEQ